MGFFTRLLRVRRHARSSDDAPWDLDDNGSELVLDAEAAELLAMEMDIDACIASHRAWRAQLQDSMRRTEEEGEGEGPPAPAGGQAPAHAATAGLPAELLHCGDAHPCAVARWLAGPGLARHGTLQAFGMLTARHRYFHQQLAAAVALLQAGDAPQARQIVNGGCMHASNQVVLLLKELRRGPLR